MGKRIEVLDHGFAELIETWGSDEAIIEAARESTDGNFRGWAGDEKLLTYLYSNDHATPFEMAGAKFRIKLPIFVAREWMRHRTQSYNEMSARYTALPNENYVPSEARLFLANFKSANKQANGNGKEIGEWKARMFTFMLEIMYWMQEKFYQYSLSIGIPRELARVCLPVGRYTRFVVQANLRNWIAFLRLREDDKAQYEIRLYAHAICKLLESRFPRSIALYKGTPLSKVLVKISPFEGYSLVHRGINAGHFTLSNEWDGALGTESLKDIQEYFPEVSWSLVTKEEFQDFMREQYNK